MTKALLATVLVFGLTGAACGGGGDSNCTSQTAAKLTGTLEIKNFSFNPSCVTVASGATISLSNSDPRGHAFTVKGTDVDVAVAYNGGVGEATAPAPGTYDFYCRLHPEMTGTIIVT
jgi:plastocyanin